MRWLNAVQRLFGRSPQPSKSWVKEVFPGAISVDDAQDPDADRAWLAALNPPPNSFRVFAGYSGSLEGVVTLENGDLRTCNCGTYQPSPSMLALLKAIRSKSDAPDKPRQDPLAGYESTTAFMDLRPFDSDETIEIRGVRIIGRRMRWRFCRRADGIEIDFGAWID